MAFSKSSDIFRLIKPTPCKPMFTILMTRSTGFAHELLGAVRKATSISRFNHLNKAIRDNLTDM